ncbi:transposase [Streptomyces sp. NPDC055955]|uniref:transposase n=1 Tax=Streptomyces sp. NPDC055955 TaxID=3345665 RepID=UPI0035DA02A9
MLDAVRYLIGNGIKSVDAGRLSRLERGLWFFRQWRDQGLVAAFHHRLRGRGRQASVRPVGPTAAIVESQSVRVAESVGASTRGWGSGKKVGSRKRHIAVDCLGMPPVVLVTSASVEDRDASLPLLKQLSRPHRKITLVWADGGYAGRLVDLAREHHAMALTVVKRSNDSIGFTVLPRGWCVERTLARLMHRRCLIRDDERSPVDSEAVVMWLMQCS